MQLLPAILITILFGVAMPLFPAFGEEVLVLTPEKTEALLLKQGIGVQLLQLENQAASMALQKSEARYDTTLSLSGDHTMDKSARSSTFFGRRTDTSHWNLGLEKNMGLGTKLGFDFENERIRLFSPNAITGNTEEPTVEPTLGFSLNQSLGRNFFGRLDRAEMAAVRAGVRVVDLETAHQVHEKLIDGLVLYWKWTIAREGIALGEEALRVTEHFLHLTLEKEELGTAEVTDRLGAQAMRAKRKAMLIGLRLLPIF